jgi:peptidyl-prolyl cis-trans isomerase A (cyclophilin A)
MTMRSILITHSVLLTGLISSGAFAQGTAAKPAMPAPATAPVAMSTPAPQVKPQVKLLTSMGEIILELEPERAPKSVENFLEYVKIGQYNDTVFHRVIPGFMVQGGGYTKELAYKSTNDPIENESNNGLSNLRGTLAMARQNEPNSATSQFFINTVDNKFLNFSGPGTGYAVFGKVIAGMDVVDKIRMVKTESTMPGFADKPIEPVIITKAEMHSVTALDAAPAATAPVTPPAKK